MDINSTPISVVPTVPHEGGIRFLHRESQIDIDPNMANKVWEILSWCNGYNNIASIANFSKLDKEEAVKILSELEEAEVIVDSRYQFMHFHRISNYPSSFNSSLTQAEVEDYTKSRRLPVKSGDILKFERDSDSALHSIREKRRSCRNFSKQKLTINQIGNICHYAYSIPDHSVPSGGALYPIRIYVLVEEAQNGLSPGYYEYDAEQDQLVLFSDEVDTEQLKYCFNQEEMPFGSSVQIIIAAELKRQPFKYANRGYRLTLIEAGHVAENISLYCAEQGLGACEMGGVQDEPLKTELGLDYDIWPLLAIPIGYPASSNSEPPNKIRFVEERIGINHPVTGVWTNVFGEDGSFFGATTTYLDGNGNTQYAGATSQSYADAVFKATIEGYERWQSGQVRVDFHGPANQIPGNWLNPQMYFPLTQKQAEKCGAKFFTENLAIDWTLGFNYDGSKIYVPSDLVYYGQKDSKNRIYYGHSSGIAAHFNFDEAKKRATIELIERDALMRSWFTKEPPHVLNNNAVPIHVKRRTAHWSRRNRRLIVLQIPSEFGMVFETIIASDEYPCFVSGAAAAIDTNLARNAILKSVQEAEYNLLLTLRYPDMTIIDPQKVLTPTDHGKVYHFKENVNELRWLYEGDVISNHVEIATVTDDLANFYNERLKLVTVDLSNDQSDIKIVRVFSPYLVPINFGFNTAHYTHPALQHSTSINDDSLKMPHYFA